MEAVDSHGFRPGAASGSATAAPVLDVPPLRAVSPIFPPPSHAFPASSPHPFIYISPFSHFATQFGAGFSSPCPPCPSFDPAEVRRKLEQDIASREKRAKRSAVRNILKTCGKNSVANGSPSSSKKVGQPAGQPVSSPDVRKKSTAKTNANDKPSASKSEAKKQTVPKTEIFDEEDVIIQTKRAAGGSTKTPASAKSKNCRNDRGVDEPDATESITKKRKKVSDSRSNRSSKGTMVFRATEGDALVASDRKLVRKALVIYDSLRRKLMQDDEANKEAPGGGGCKRPDLKAGTIMMDRGLCVHRDRRIIGAVPGVHVGDLFYFRMELCVIGLHGHVMAGIDYINAKCNQWNEPVATSIISSGGYEDDEDDGEVLIYTGQGGNNYKTDKKQTDDQKLERGNLALERSMHHGVEIRVIRGIKDNASPSGKTYIYDGLYKVQDSWLDKGRSGFSVFKYKLQRIPGQPDLGSALLKSTRQWKSQPSSRPGLLLSDLSSRNENVPICLVNNVDDDKGPSHFEYISKVRYSNSVGKLEPCQGCDCKSGCTPGDKCSCIPLNGGEMPYNPNGYLVKWKPLVYECGDQCRCPPSCRNRVSQKGLKNHFEVFKTNDRGWGVRSWDPIPAGSFVCEYTGEVQSDSDTEEEGEDNDYLLHANRTQENRTLWDGIADILSEQKQGTSSQPPLRPNITIDASKMGNVSRFMNHSCSPNIFRQSVLYDHNDTQFPHIMLFAIENIPPLTELTFDYGLRASPVQKCDEKGESKGSGKSKVCLCGATDCRGKFC
eukprot:Gb_09748 [translate_table: standard]